MIYAFETLHEENPITFSRFDIKTPNDQPILNNELKEVYLIYYVLHNTLDLKT